jgi:hypothetical protein
MRKTTHATIRRFPLISGFRVSWDSRKPAGQRVLGVWLLTQSDDSDSDNEGSTDANLHSEPVERTKDRKYKIVTREYMAQGHDGFLALKKGKYLIDDESGHLFSSIVRRYLLGEDLSG